MSLVLILLVPMVVLSTGIQQRQGDIGNANPVSPFPPESQYLLILISKSLNIVCVLLVTYLKSFL